MSPQLPVSENSQRLYTDLSYLWSVISPKEDYIGEAEEFVRAIRKHARIEVKTLLDLGCGGGHNDFTLKKYFQVTGVDLSPVMLELARDLNPEIEYLQGDMRNLRLGRLFDAVMVADSISYMLNQDDLLKVFQTAYAHLNPGGVFCTYAEETPERFTHNRTYHTFHTQGDLEVVMVENYYGPDPGDTTYELTFVYLIRRAGQLSIESDHHRLGLFPAETWQRLLQEVGFSVRLEWSDELEALLFTGIKSPQ